MLSDNDKIFLENFIYHCNENLITEWFSMQQEYSYANSYMTYADASSILNLINSGDCMKFTKSGFEVFMNLSVYTYKNYKFIAHLMKDFIVYYKYTFNDINYQLWHSEYI